MTYKVWLHIEQIDEDNDDATEDIGLPVQLGEFDNEGTAIEYTNTIEAIHRVIWPNWIAAY